MNNSNKVGISVPAVTGNLKSQEFATALKNRLQNEYFYDAEIAYCDTIEKQAESIEHFYIDARHIVMWPLQPATALDSVIRQYLEYNEEWAKPIIYREPIDGVEDISYFVSPDYTEIGVQIGEVFADGWHLHDYDNQIADESFHAPWQKTVYFVSYDTYTSPQVKMFAGAKSVLDKYVEAGLLQYREFFNVADDTSQENAISNIAQEISAIGNAGVVCFDDRLSDLFVTEFINLGVNPPLIGFGGTQNTQANLDSGMQTLSISEDVTVAAEKIADLINDYDNGSQNFDGIKHFEEYYEEESTNTPGKTVSGLRIPFIYGLSSDNDEIRFPDSDSGSGGGGGGETPSGKVLKSVTVKKPPKKRFYLPGARLDLNGLKLTAEYDDGTGEEDKLAAQTKTPRFTNAGLSQDFTFEYAKNGVKKDVTVRLYKQTGPKSDNDCAEQDFGDCGKGELNLFTRKMKFKTVLAEKNDGSVPFKISGVYSHGQGNEHFVGTGWRLNLNQRVFKASVTEDGETEIKWVYEDKDGKLNYFESGYNDGADEEKAAGRSDIRCEELGLDLFTGTNDLTLIDRSGNSMYFIAKQNGGSEYLLKEMHAYPSKRGAAKAERQVVITYNSDYSIKSVTAGLTADGKVPKFLFCYENGKLAKIKYNRDGAAAESEFYTVAELSYIVNELTLVTRKETADCDIISQTKFSRADENISHSAMFEVTNLASKDELGNFESLKYEMFGSGAVFAVSQGYGEKRETINVSSTSVLKKPSEPTDVISTTELKKNGKVTAVSFNSYAEAARWSYEKGENGESYNKFQRVLSANSNGFDPKSFDKSYANTLDICRDAFYMDSLFGWSNGTISDEATTATRSLKHTSGGALTKTVTLNGIENGESVYLSAWVKGYNPQITLTVIRGEQSSQPITFKCSQSYEKWQFASMGLPSLLKGDKVKIEVSHGKAVGQEPALYLGEFRMVKAPYETKTDIPDNKYNPQGNVTESYVYEPITQKVVCTKTSYKTDGVTKTDETRSYVGGGQISKTEWTYDGDYRITSVKSYGSGTSYTQITKTYGANGVLKSETDENGVTTSYEVKPAYTKTTVGGETGSPSTVIKDEYFEQSDKLKQTSALSGSAQTEAMKNTLAYNPDGSLSYAEYAFENLAGSENSNGEKAASSVQFGYDSFGNIAATFIGGRKLVEFLYDDKHKTAQSFANGYKENYEYNSDDQLTKVTDGNGNTVAEVEYLKTEGDYTRVYSGNRKNSSEDYAVSTEYAETHASYGVEVNADGIISTAVTEFNNVPERIVTRPVACGRLGNESVVRFEKHVNADVTNIETVKTVKDENNVLKKAERFENKTVSGTANITQTYGYDDLYRLTKKTSAFNGKKTFETDFTYRDGANKKTNLVKSETYKNGDTEAGSFNYDYYANGNVKQIKSGSTVKVAYEYDEFNRLIAEINYAAGKKFAYAYDSAGNVLTKHTYAITNNVIAAVASDVTTYGYTKPLWRDQLTKIDNRYTIEYDAAGNPVKYKDYALEWKGNRLTKFDNTTFVYDINGLRVKKNDTHYYLSGDKIIVERRVEDGAVKFVYYRYDDSGVCGMNYDGTDYYFRKNIFGDIIEVFAADGTSVASFVYDAYGKVLTESGTMASKVPFRYRGYYYDQETRLYYLQSRYYDPATGRFISPDSIEYLDPAVIHGLNLYAYCGNNPVMNVDPDGTEWWKQALWSAAALAIAIGSFVVIGLVLAGTISTAGFGGFFLGVAVGALMDMGKNIVSQINQKGSIDIDPKQLTLAGVKGGIKGGIATLGSMAFSMMGGMFGEQFGYSLGKTIIGRSLSSELLMGIGGFSGGILGGILGDTFMNYAGNHAFGDYMSPEESLQQGVLGEIPGWIISIIQWLIS